MAPHDRLKREVDGTAAASIVDLTVKQHVSPSTTKTMTAGFAADAEGSAKNANTTDEIAAWSSILVWPCVVAVPLLLSSPYSPMSYHSIFPAAWHTYDSASSTPKPLGLFLGILAVLVGQISVWVFFYMFKFGLLGRNSKRQQPKSIQTSGARPYDFWEGLQTHISQPEGFVLLVGYLTVTWMFHFMPHSYYSFEGTIQWDKTFVCLVLQDAIQYLMHWLEHAASPKFYQLSHKPHHRFTNPRIFDAFNGSLADTVCMIIIPLFITANLMRTCNVWTYMAFGSLYASWLTLIHSEYSFVWDGAFRSLGFGTPADHHVHHKLFKYNYGHLFMWCDRLFGTYRDPKELAPKIFNEGI